jgi:hypothetical protein
MRRALSIWLALVACVALFRVAAAQAPGGADPHFFPLGTLVCPDNLLRACCDIYCPKPQPCVCCYCFGRTNDCYCCKPQPCIDCFRGPHRSDCYCPKPLPYLCRPIFADYFRCVPKSDGCVESCAPDSTADYSSAPAPTNDPDDGANGPPKLPVPPDLN